MAVHEKIQREELDRLLEDVAAGQISPREARRLLEESEFVDMGFAKIDVGRNQRRGFPEVIFCDGKSNEQIAAIAAKFLEKETMVMASRATPEQFAAIQSVAPAAQYFEQARIVLIGEIRPAPCAGFIAVLTGGTSDIPVAEEAAVTLEAFGQPVERFYDVGVAGIQRLFAVLERVREAHVVVTIAGMEGALPSVVAGLISAPVIAVPTSVGYGASFEGLAPLLTMLNSCSPGIGVVNIDNGFGAGYLAANINSRAVAWTQAVKP